VRGPIRGTDLLDRPTPVRQRNDRRVHLLAVIKTPMAPGAAFERAVFARLCRSFDGT